MGGLLLGNIVSILLSSSSNRSHAQVGLVSVFIPLLLVVETVESDS